MTVIAIGGGNPGGRGGSGGCDGIIICVGTICGGMGGKGVTKKII